MSSSHNENVVLKRKSWGYIKKKKKKKLVWHLNVALCFFNDFCIISKERRGKNLRCQRMSKVPFSPFHSVQQVMLRILWFSFKKLCSWNQHLWPVQNLRRKVWFVALLWEQNLRKGMTWWDTYERLHLLVLLVSFFSWRRGMRSCDISMYSC